MLRMSFYIAVTYSLLGLLYAPGFYSFVAFLFILVSCAPLLIGARFDFKTMYDFHRVPSAFLYWLIVILGFLNLALIAISVGYGISEIFLAEGIKAIAAAATAKRYLAQEGSGNVVLLAFSLWLLYRLGTVENKVPGWMILTGFLPVLFYSILTTEKWPMFLSGVFFLSGLVVAQPYVVSRKVVLRYAVIFISIGGVFSTAALSLRGVEGGQFILMEHLLHYVLAPFAAFGHWLYEYATADCCSLGHLSFIGPIDALGLGERAAGVFLDTVVVNGLETNIYTAWRYLVQDFSIFGPLLLNSLLVLLFIAFKQIRKESFAYVLGGAIVFGSFLSLNVTPFVHNSVALAMLLSLVSSGVAKRKKSYENNVGAK